MKLIYKLLFAIVFIVMAQSCEDIVGGDINRDPNNPTAVPVTAQLPAIQIALADTYGGSFSRWNCMLSQQVEGVARQWSSFNQYTGLTPNRFDAAWNNIYENILNELHIARASSQENGFNHFEGIADVMEAYALMISTDVWDAIPYSQALQGIDEQNPPYDEQASIYSAVNGFLDGAISKFGGAPGGVAPGNEDVFYGGDIALWTKATRAIKARGLMHTKDYAGAMSLAMQSFESAGENMGYQFPDAGAAGPWYRFNDGRTGDIEFHPTMRTLMTDLNDMDRLAIIDVIFVTDAPYTASHPYIRPDFFQELITFREMQFLIAEADFRVNGGSQAGYDAYLAGIQASFEKMGADGYDAYVAQSEVAPGVGNLTLEHIMTQKYIALFLQPETFSDFRRTGIPSLAPVSGTAIPVRWPLPATEELFNTSAPAPGTINIFTDRVGWNR